uniref:Uncharacterized protein n=1 Tax=Nelumbo nucifera TaxID=4432 RepID=A0A822ZKD8_NELNU|nr:TPA_asm: hypothetical protein HUJ06_003210 [Nelumbo nucifera]
MSLALILGHTSRVLLTLHRQERISSFLSGSRTILFTEDFFFPASSLFEFFTGMIIFICLLSVELKSLWCKSSWKGIQTEKRRNTEATNKHCGPYIKQLFDRVHSNQPQFVDGLDASSLSETAQKIAGLSNDTARWITGTLPQNI